MSSSGGDVFSKTVNKATEKVGGFLGDIGISDESTKGSITGGLLGSQLPGGLIPGAALGKIQGEKVEQARDEAAAADEAARVRFNEDIFRLAESLQGKIASRPEFDFESLEFIGSDPREERLKRLVQSFTTRSDEVFSSRFEPGISQTRLSLVE